MYSGSDHVELGPLRNTVKLPANLRAKGRRLTTKTGIGLIIDLPTKHLWVCAMCPQRRQWQPTPVLLPGESQERRSLVGCVYGVAQSRTQLKRLSSSSSSYVSCLMLGTGDTVVGRRY